MFEEPLVEDSEDGVADVLVNVVGGFCVSDHRVDLGQVPHVVVSVEDGCGCVCERAEQFWRVEHGAGATRVGLAATGGDHVAVVAARGEESVFEFDVVSSASGVFHVDVSRALAFGVRASGPPATEQVFAAECLVDSLACGQMVEPAHGHD